MHPKPLEARPADVDEEVQSTEATGPQLKETLGNINKRPAKRSEETNGWKKVSTVVDPGATGIVIDPVDALPDPLQATAALRVG